MNAGAYKDFAESYDLSFEQLGEHEPQVVEFFRTRISSGVQTKNLPS
jgi:hypothetical protein